MRLATGYEYHRPRIDMVSLIDVMFLVLTYFILGMLAMTVQRGIKVNLPSAAGERPDQPAFTVTIADNNELSVDGRTVSREEAVSMAAAWKEQGGKSVFIRSDGAAQFGVAVELLDALRKVGVNSISVQVKEEAHR